MPGLINDPAYDASREAILKAHPEAEAAFDAAEWELLLARDLDQFEEVEQLSWGKVRVCRIPASAHTPTLIVPFLVEDFEGEHKLLLLDAALEDDLAEPSRKVKTTKSTRDR